MIELDKQRLVDREKIPADPPEDKALRPQNFDEYIGQQHVCQQLKIFIHACKQRNESLDHALLFGPAGLGKTTLANIIAKELGVNFRQTSGPVLEKPGDLASILSSLERGDVLFIDEIHRLSPNIEEIMYPALEDFQLDIVIGEGLGARNMKVNLAPFTLVAATTRAGMLTKPLRDRFGISMRLNFYSNSDISKIIQRSAKLLKLSIEDDACMQIAQRSRGTPRIANRLLRRVRDIAQFKNWDTINNKDANEALDFLQVDRAGLDEMDRKILHLLIEKFSCKAVGLETLSAAMNESADTIQEIIEPYLIQEGFIERTARGRLVTEQAVQHYRLHSSESR